MTSINQCSPVLDWVAKINFKTPLVRIDDYTTVLVTLKDVYLITRKQICIVLFCGLFANYTKYFYQFYLYTI